MLSSLSILILDITTRPRDDMACLARRLSSEVLEPCFLGSSQLYHHCELYELWQGT